MRLTTLMIPLLATTAFAAPTLAQDRETHFDGPYIGGTIGTAAQSNSSGNAVEFDTNRDGTFGETVTTVAGANAFSPGFCNSATSTATVECHGQDDGLEYAVRLGYDSRMGNIVLGGLIEASKSESIDGASAFSTTPAGYSFARELDYAVSARARLGYTPNGGALFYVTGGGSYAKLDHTFTTTNTVNAFTANNDDEMVWGWQAGGGAEVMLGNNLSLGLEYLYNRYDDDNYSVSVTRGSAGATNPFLLNGGGTNMRPSDTRYDFHSLRATVSLQF